MCYINCQNSFLKKCVLFLCATFTAYYFRVLKFFRRLQLFALCKFVPVRMIATTTCMTPLLTNLNLLKSIILKFYAIFIGFFLNIFPNLIFKLIIFLNYIFFLQIINKKNINLISFMHSKCIFFNFI